MKKAAHVLLTLYSITSLLSFILGIIVFFILVTGGLNVNAWPNGLSTVLGIYLIILVILSIAGIILASAFGKKGYIACIVLGVITLNIFGILGGIFALKAQDEESSFNLK